MGLKESTWELVGKGKGKYYDFTIYYFNFTKLLINIVF